MQLLRMHPCTHAGRVHAQPPACRVKALRLVVTCPYSACAGDIIELFEGYMRLHGAPLGGEATLPRHLQLSPIPWRTYISALPRYPRLR